MSRIQPTFEALKAARPQGADPLHHRRRPVCRRDAPNHAGDGRGRRRRDRARRSVLRPDGRWAGDPESVRAGPCQGHWHAASAALRARVPREGHAHADRADGLRQPDRALRPAARRWVFRQACAEAGVDGVLVVDYPPEECETFAQALRSNGIDPIFMLAPTSTTERMEQVGRIASGYVYYVSLKGVTGAGTSTSRPSQPWCRASAAMCSCRSA